MYTNTKENKSPSLFNLVLIVIAVLIIIFIVAWIAYKSNGSTSSKSFSLNLNSMQETAKEYFGGNLPKNIGESKTITLEEMYDLDLIDNLKVGNNACDKDESYSSITKSSETEYKVRTNLVCGTTNDNVIEKIGTKTFIADENGNAVEADNTATTNTDKKEESTTTTTTVEETKDTTTNKKEESTTNTTTNNSDMAVEQIDDDVVSLDGKTPSKTPSKTCTAQGECEINVLPTRCETEYQYEYIKKITSCEDGFILSNGTCIRTTTETATPSNDYTNAKIKVNEETEYTAPVIDSTTDAYCDEGTLINGRCYIYTKRITNTTTTCPEGYTLSNGKCIIEKTKSNTCPEGYTLTDGKCTKTVERTENKKTTCPEGYTLKDNKCTKTINRTENKKTTCPSGYTLSNGKCTKTINRTENKKTTCPSGYTLSNGKCYKYANKVANTTYYCPSGYSQSGNTCYKSVPVYSWYSNPYSSFSSSYDASGISGDTKTVCTKKLGGYVCYRYARSVSYTYQYAQLLSNTTYTCPSGYANNGSNCVASTNATTTVTYTCPTGYTNNGSKCVITTNPTTTVTYTCPSGYTDNGSKCVITTNPTTTTTYTCPSGYTEKNNKCVKTIEIVKVCPEGYTESGNKCIKTTNPTTTVTYTCPEGYAKNDKQCYKTVPAKSKTETNYSCPEGYTSTGTGADMKCFKTIQGETSYYCENPADILKDDKCYSSVSTCPSGFVLSNGICARTTNETTTPIYTVTERIYSSNPNLAGYSRTGVEKIITICTAIYK